MNSEARLARLEHRQRAGDEAFDLEHLRLGAAIVLAKYKGDKIGLAALRAELALLPPPIPGGALDATLCYATRFGLMDGDPDDQSPEMPGCRRPIVREPSAAVAMPSGAQDASVHDRNQGRT